ncbi:DNA ligase D [Paenibacillus sp. N4]|uniref:DNA ligase D n=1 Tax=Paenibacillus vietnamensis TaxID=2590547 RepID=UPI001CD15C7A|nr:DNA ligase D [Paenibacillus vietnamensis]MCA0757743.1 DNA ligase D [Paenibacillus vietnamensis]
MDGNRVMKLPSKKEGLYKGYFIITGYHTLDESFTVGLSMDDEVQPVGAFTGGMSREEKQSLKETIMANPLRNRHPMVWVNPGICVELTFESMEQGRLMNPSFQAFRFSMDWRECTWNKLIVLNASDPHQVKLTHPDKIIWEHPRIDKEGFVAYLIQVSPYMLPFLRKRVLTTIRYPHGVPGESFYQKNSPDYAPDFIKTAEWNGNIVCNDLSALIWLGNQLAVEYHIPFQTVETELPLEIVIDLDPPGRERFPLAVKAALELKAVFDSFGIVSFPKLSGGKGLQIHIPIPGDASLTYEDTRILTSFLADYLVQKHPDDFTVERLKKNRGERLYVDYIQHAAGKTIVCPYSARGNEEATVAAPLYWHEVNGQLTAKTFNIPFVLDRLAGGECPMRHFFQTDNRSLLTVLSMLKEKKRKK